LIVSFFVSIENITSRGGKEGWISDNINKGCFDKYYWVIIGFSALNLLDYLVCSWAYGPTVDEVSKVKDWS
jgi:peptide/histidine transporter 3/4